MRSGFRAIACRSTPRSGLSFTKVQASAQDRTRDSVRDMLKRDGYSLRQDEGDSTIYVNDPDGNVVQLEAAGFAT